MMLSPPSGPFVLVRACTGWGGEVERSLRRRTAIRSREPFPATALSSFELQAEPTLPKTSRAGFERERAMECFAARSHLRDKTARVNPAVILPHRRISPGDEVTKSEIQNHVGQGDDDEFPCPFARWHDQTGIRFGVDGLGFSLPENENSQHGKWRRNQGTHQKQARQHAKREPREKHR